MKTKNFIPYGEEERRIRKRMVEIGVRQKDIVIGTGILKQDVSNVIRQRSKSTSYIAEIYHFLGLGLPPKLASGNQLPTCGD